MNGKTKISSVKENQKQSSAQTPESESKTPVANSNKIKVFTVKRKDETTLVKRTYLVDVSLTIPVPVKSSCGPKKLWVPKSA